MSGVSEHWQCSNCGSDNACWSWSSHSKDTIYVCHDCCFSKTIPDKKEVINIFLTGGNN